MAEWKSHNPSTFHNFLHVECQYYGPGKGRIRSADYVYNGVPPMSDLKARTIINSPVILKDTDGVDHQFHFSIRLMGKELVMRSFETEETRSEGYEFGMIGDIEDGLFSLFSKLYARMIKTLNRKHIYKDEETKSWQVTEDDIVRGQITCDPETEDISRDPMMIIDGKGISWKEFGEMLMTYEGFNFKLQIFDPDDEMD